MKITWTLVYYFVHCPRQAWFFSNNIKAEHTSEDVKIWKILHELKYWNLTEKDFSEVEFNDFWIKIDKINFKNDQIETEEFKKAWKELKAQFFQVLYYLYIFENFWIKAKWKLIFDEKHKINEKDLKGLDYTIKGFKIYIPFTQNNKNKLLQVLKQLKNILSLEKPPEKFTSKSWWPHKKCRWCSYFYLCWV